MDDDTPVGEEPIGSRWERVLAAAQAKGVPLRTILTVDAVVIATWVLYRLIGRLREVILWILIAAFIALVLNPPVNSLTHVAESLPTMVDQLQKGHGWLAHTLQRLHLLTWVQKNAPKLET